MTTALMFFSFVLGVVATVGVIAVVAVTPRRHDP